MLADLPRSADGSLVSAFGPREALIGRMVVSASLRIFKASLSGGATDLISTSAIRVTPGCSEMVSFAVCNVGSAPEYCQVTKDQIQVALSAI